MATDENVKTGDGYIPGNWRTLPPYRVACPRCGAAVGQQCTTESITGLWGTSPHSGRWKAATGMNSKEWWDARYARPA